MKSSLWFSVWYNFRNVFNFPAILEKCNFWRKRCSMSFPFLVINTFYNNHNALLCKVHCTRKWSMRLEKYHFQNGFPGWATPCNKGHLRFEVSNLSSACCIIIFIRSLLFPQIWTHKFLSFVLAFFEKPTRNRWIFSLIDDLFLHFRKFKKTRLAFHECNNWFWKNCLGNPENLKEKSYRITERWC